MTDTVTSGARLKELRLKLRIGQVEFAKAIGVPQSNLSPWESGKRAVPPPVLLAACYMFGASQSWLMDGLGPMFQADLDLSGNTAAKGKGIYQEEMSGVNQAIRAAQFTKARNADPASCLPEGRYNALLNGQDVPTWGELNAIAKYLRTDIRELAVKPDGTPIEVDLSKVNPQDPIFPIKRPPLEITRQYGDLEACTPEKGPSSLSEIRQDIAALKKDVAAIKRKLAKP